MTRYYAYISGSANVLTDFNPYSSYTENGNYIRLEFNGEIYNPVAALNSGAVWYVNNNGWFSFELYPDNWQYMNFGGATYIGRYYDWGTSGLETTTVFEYDNGTATVSKGDQVVTTNYTGSAGRGKMPFFPSIYARNLRMNFYRLGIYGQNDTLLYEFVPYLSGDTKGIYETVEDKFFPAENQSLIELVPYSVFSVDPEEVAAVYTSGSTTISVDADEAVSWSASTEANWISLSSTGGTGSGSVSITWGENSTYSSRNAVITFVSSEGDTAETHITQAEHPVLIPKNNIYREGKRIN